MTDDVLVVPTGIANTASVLAAFTRLDATPRLCGDATALAEAAAVVLPGVGAFGAAVQRLDELGVRAALIKRIASGRPTLAICLGLQLLCTASEESPGAPGLGIIDATITRFPPTVRVPQMGWNHVAPTGCELLQPGHAVFANTYRLAEIPEGWAGAVTDHGGAFASALERGPVLACQFHPEISGAFGQDLLQRWLQRAREAA